MKERQGFDENSVAERIVAFEAGRVLTKDEIEAVSGAETTVTNAFQLDYYDQFN